MENWLRYSSITLLTTLFLVEFFIDQKEQKQLYRKRETIQNVIIGVGLLFTSFLSKVFILAIWKILFSIRLFTIHQNWITFLLLFILVDFSYYWYHRISHSINWFWTSHSVHHSGEAYNLSVAFRQSWTQQFSGQFIFWLWLPLIGFDPSTIFIAYSLCFIYQSWLHTELIRKLHPAFEYIFNTPSHHRIHHSSNVKYLDKNHGGVFIIWDRLFNTFQQEEESPVYGLTKHYPYQNASVVMWHGWKELFKNISNAESFSQKLNYLVKAPGWMPENPSISLCSKSPE